jgi:TRAP-type mannitol/chloroaromatic compound transport system substrate-binding protein
MDMDLGFYQVAKNNYFPGWHQQVSVNELLMHKPAWEALSDQYKAMVELACGEQIHYNYAETEANNPNAMNKMVQEHGVEIRRWTDAELAAFEEGWLEVLKEQSAADPTFKKVADSYLAFRETYKPWGQAQFLKSTYLGQ